MSWVFGLTDLTGVSIGRLHWATERSLSLPLNGLPNANFQLRLDDPLANEITDRAGDVLLKVYHGSTLQFVGDCVSVEEIGGESGSTLACNFAGPFWRLQKRLIGTGFDGAGFTRDVAANTIISDMLSEANTAANTGIQAGTMDTLYRTKVGPWRFKPIAEAWAEMQAAKIPFPVDAPPGYVQQDTFTGSGVVHARTDDSGKTWTSTGDGPDWTVGGGHALRSNTNDAGAGDGRKAVSNLAAQASAVWGWDYQSSIGSAGAPVWLDFRFYARYDGAADEWVRAVVNFNTTPPDLGQIYLQKKVGGTATILGIVNFTSPYPIAASAWYSVRILADDAGNYSLWHYQQGQTPQLMFGGRDTDLATGGAVESGTIAFGDHNFAGALINRYFDNVFVSAYTGPQSFDFELEPIEPTSAPVKIADLNIEYALGTDRPEVIFEYGAGNRSVKSYRRVLSRDGLLNKAWSLNSEFPDAPSGFTSPDIRAAEDATSIAARGLFEEVVSSDVVDGELRQALVIAHVGVRKVAKEDINFEGSQTAPVFGTDYFVGDTVTARALVNGTVRFNGTVRVYGIELSIDENGKEDLTPVLVAV